MGEFLDFHNANAHVLEFLILAAFEYRQATGHKKCSIDFLMHRVRWELDVDVKNPDLHAAGFKLNDNHTPFYARLAMAREPELRGMFELRKALADADWSWVERAA